MPQALRVQTDRAVSFMMKEQADPDILETGSGAEELRFANSSGLVFPRGRIASRESRKDGRARRGGLGRGQCEFALSNDYVIGAYDTVKKAVMRTTPVAAANKSQADFGQLTVSGDTVTFANTTAISGGIKVGQKHHYTSGLAVADRNTNLVVIAVTTNSVRYHRALTTVAVATDFAMVIHKTMVQDAVDYAYTVEERRDNHDSSEVGGWTRWSSFGISYGVDQNIDFSCAGMARLKRTLTGSGSPGFTNPTRPLGNGLVAPNARLYIVGYGFLRLSAFSFSFDNQMSREDSTDVEAYEMIPGQPKISAQFTHIESNLDLEDDYLAEEALNGFLLIEEAKPTGLRPSSCIWFTDFTLSNPAKSGAGADRSSTRTYQLEPDINESGGAFYNSNIILTSHTV